jgi:hypothetical protein
VGLHFLKTKLCATPHSVVALSNQGTTGKEKGQVTGHGESGGAMGEVEASSVNRNWNCQSLGQKVDATFHGAATDRRICQIFIDCLPPDTRHRPSGLIAILRTLVL